MSVSLNGICYPIPWGGQLILQPNVVEHLWNNRQRGLMKERGGQLFGTFNDDGETVVEFASGPIKPKYSSWNRLIPDREYERREITEMYGKGLHYLGDWHTHRAAVPVPSYQDATTLKSCFAESKGKRRALVMLIVGRARFPQGLSVSVVNNECITLTALD